MAVVAERLEVQGVVILMVFVQVMDGELTIRLGDEAAPFAEILEVEAVFSSMQVQGQAELLPKLKLFLLEPALNKPSFQKCSKCAILRSMHFIVMRPTLESSFLCLYFPKNASPTVFLLQSQRDNSYKFRLFLIRGGVSCFSIPLLASILTLCRLFLYVHLCLDN